jgi:hypothetical protein
MLECFFLFRKVAELVKSKVLKISLKRKEFVKRNVDNQT